MLDIILITITYLFFICLFSLKFQEDFFSPEINKYPDVKFFVISLADNNSGSNSNRKTNIKIQEEKLQAPIKIFDAIDGNKISQEELLTKNILGNNFFLVNTKRNKEIGCYMSHIALYNIILETNIITPYRYTCIFEDDFKLGDNFNLEEILSTLSKLNNDFDICFLGNTFDNHGIQIANNIYSIDKNKSTIGTYGYLIANSNIKKIVQLTKLIDSPIDNKLDNLIKNNLLNCVVCYPNVVHYQDNYISSIG